MRLSALTLLLLCAIAACAPAGAHARGLQLGFFDKRFLSGPGGPTLLGEARALGSQVVRIEVSWRTVAPRHRPPGFEAANPAAPGYTWGPVDAAVSAASARGLRVLLTLNEAPAWAEGSGRASTASPGSWRPDPGALRDFTVAAARRYSGAFPDPGRPGVLPRVRLWQVWNEPNLELYLSPQAHVSGKRYVALAARHYRRMLNAAYFGLKSVNRTNFVVTAGTAPFGDFTSRRTPPVRFVRALLCLKGTRKLRRAPCPDPAHFDALAHHPYSVRGPFSRAFGDDDVSVPDVRKLARVLRTAVRARRALPRRRKRLWVTEISWDSRPADPAGIPEARQARWLAESFYVLWRQGVDTITWFQVRDQERGAGYPFTYQSGALLVDGRPKLSARSFVFPFVSRRRSTRRVEVWGRSPRKGRVSIQERRHGRWRSIARLRTRSGRVFRGSLKLRRGPRQLRAKAGSAASLSRPQR